MAQVIQNNVQALQDSARDDSRRVWAVINVRHSKGITAFHLRNTRPESFLRIMKLLRKALGANAEKAIKGGNTQ